MRMRFGSCIQGSYSVGSHSGQRCRMRMNENPLWWKAAFTTSYRISGIQSTTWATNETFCTPSVTVSGLSASRYEPRGEVLVLVPLGEVGEACFLVRP